VADTTETDAALIATAMPIALDAAAFRAEPLSSVRTFVTLAETATEASVVVATLKETPRASESRRRRFIEYTVKCEISAASTLSRPAMVISSANCCAAVGNASNVISKDTRMP